MAIHFIIPSLALPFAFQQTNKDNKPFLRIVHFISIRKKKKVAEKF